MDKPTDLMYKDCDCQSDEARVGAHLTEFKYPGGRTSACVAWWMHCKECGKPWKRDVEARIVPRSEYTQLEKFAGQVQAKT